MRSDLLEPSRARGKREGNGSPPTPNLRQEERKARKSGQQAKKRTREAARTKTRQGELPAPRVRVTPKLERRQLAATVGYRRMFSRP